MVNEYFLIHYYPDLLSRHSISNNWQIIGGFDQQITGIEVFVAKVKDF